MSEKQEQLDPVKELKKYGIKYEKYNENKKEYHFKCDKHPYQEETIPAQTRQELFNKLGNLVSYNADTKKLSIKTGDLSVNN